MNGLRHIYERLHYWWLGRWRVIRASSSVSTCSVRVAPAVCALLDVQQYGISGRLRLIAPAGGMRVSWLYCGRCVVPI